MPRKIQPMFNSNADNVTVSFCVNPDRLEEMEFDLEQEVQAVCRRHELLLGTVFTVVFVNVKKDRVLAMQQWMVHEARPRVAKQNMDHVHTLQSNVIDRKAVPIGEMIDFEYDDEEPHFEPRKQTFAEGAAQKEATKNGSGGDHSEGAKPRRRRLSEEIKKTETDYSKLPVGKLQKLAKQRLGQGFPVGTPKKSIAMALEALDRTEAAKSAA